MLTNKWTKFDDKDAPGIPMDWLLTIEFGSGSRTTSHCYRDTDGDWRYIHTGTKLKDGELPNANPIAWMPVPEPYMGGTLFDVNPYEEEKKLVDDINKNISKEILLKCMQIGTQQQMIKTIAPTIFPVKANHKTLGEITLYGLRTECESNNNLMYLTKLDNEYVWVYDYQIISVI